MSALPAPSLQDLATACRDDLVGYSTFVDRNYRPNRFHRFVARKVAAALAQGHGRLMVFAPPQVGKSELISRKLPAYILGRYPDRRIIAASYGDDLVQFQGAAVRDLVASPEHRMVFPDAPMRGDSAARDFFRTEQGGRYMGTTVRGGATGHSADVFVIDDPFKDRAEADSVTVRKSVYDWYKSVVYTRLQTDSVLIIMHTRWHVDDLAGRLLEDQRHEGWQVITLPALAEAGDQLGREVGEALVPERFDRAAYDRIRQTLGGGDARDWLALYQQRPIAEGGGEFKDGWLQYYSNVSGGRGMTKVILVDPASGKRSKDKSADNDYTSMWVIGLGSDNNFYVLDIVRDRLNLAQRTKTLFRLHRKWMPEHPVRYEEYGLQADIEHVRAEQERLQYRFKVVPVGGRTDKANRIRRMIPAFATGRVYFPNQLWYTTAAGELVDLISVFIEEEYKSFPVGRHDDAMDGLSRLWEPNEAQDPDLELSWPGVDRSPPLIDAWLALDTETAY